MDYKLKWILSIVFLTSIPLIAIAEPNNGITPIKEELLDIPSLVDFYAEKHGVSKEVMHWIVSCESNYIPDAQSKHRYKRDNPKWGVKVGDQELSFGLAQIHLPSWGNITYEQAIDPDFALNFLAEKLSEGKGELWTCYRNKY